MNKDLIASVFKWPADLTLPELNDARADLGIVPARAVPCAERNGEFEIKVHRGAKITEVRLISGPENPYRDMYIAALQTWGTPGGRKADTWERTTVENRMKVIYAVMTRQALPLAREIPDFFFEIRNISRISYDQIVRARIGVSVSSLGTRNNDVTEIDVMCPPRIYDDERSLRTFYEMLDACLGGYHELVEHHGQSWEDARYGIVQGILHGFTFDINYEALAALLGQRMMFCMEFSTVATAWKMWLALKERYAILAAPIRPNCDLAKKCTFRREGTIGEAFSNDPHSGCGRWPDPRPVGHFPGPSTEPSWIDDWTDGAVFAGDVPTDWQAAFEKDERYFL